MVLLAVRTLGYKVMMCTTAYERHSAGPVMHYWWHCNAIVNAHFTPCYQRSLLPQACTLPQLPHVFQLTST